MSNKRDIVEISDHRSGEQRHQLHRHAVRSKKRENQTTLHHSSRPPKDSRSAARSWKRQELNMIQDYADVKDIMYDEPLDFGSPDDTYHYNRTTSDSKSSKMFLMGTAISGSDAAFLISLKLMLREKYGSRRYRSRNLEIKERRLHTMLTYVIDQRDSEGIRIVLDNIFSGYIYKTIIEHVCSNGRTALWYACRNGDLELVQELIIRGHANINKCGVLIVAAQNGHEKIVDYLLKRGCDVNRRVRNYNESALHAASRRNHLGIVNLLLKYGAISTLRDKQKRTALDYAIHKRHIEIAKVLIYHQHGCFNMSPTGYTPLMLAAYCENTPIIDILWNVLPLQQVLDELSLLACKYIIGGNASKRDKAYCYFEMALSRRTPLHDSISCAAYEFLSECHTLDELALIRENDNKMRMYAFLVSERLLLKSDQINHHLSLIIKQSYIYKWNGSPHSEMRLTTYNRRGVTRLQSPRHESPDNHDDITTIHEFNRLNEIKNWQNNFISGQTILGKIFVRIPNKIYNIL
ncbi:unnamed protein product [Adineta steineri]|uniref:Ankyrin repeat protein n=1 Tax=Adineta steineri TaxID=433720 RepID=A0A814XC94_9BILA|nr:unnamed protein product [Adineta steineri]CAF3689894.1 unnamed protein product [Adineta steineri]CAF3771195.1 unnamed protein product [Adineta steineri]